MAAQALSRKSIVALPRRRVAAPRPNTFLPALSTVARKRASNQDMHLSLEDLDRTVDDSIPSEIPADGWRWQGQLGARLQYGCNYLFRKPNDRLTDAKAIAEAARAHGHHNRPYFCRHLSAIRRLQSTRFITRQQQNHPILAAGVALETGKRRWWWIG
jgi:hypothetical protein